MDQTVKADAEKSSGSSERKTVVLGRPVVLVLKRERRTKGSRTSSRGTRRLTEIDRRASKALRRVTRALDHGIDSYIEHRDKSKEKRRDGAVVDFVENVSYGVSKTLSDASPVLHDVAEALNTRRWRKQTRRIARAFARIPLIG